MLDCAVQATHHSLLHKESVSWSVTIATHHSLWFKWPLYNWLKVGLLCRSCTWGLPKNVHDNCQPKLRLQQERQACRRLTISDDHQHCPRSQHPANAVTFHLVKRSQPTWQSYWWGARCIHALQPCNLLYLIDFSVTPDNTTRTCGTEHVVKAMLPQTIMWQGSAASCHMPATTTWCTPVTYLRHSRWRVLRIVWHQKCLCRWRHQMTRCQS
jgi:hypothetical protein